MSNIKIKELNKNSNLSPVIAEIHENAFPDFFLTKLGRPFLTTLYQGYIEDRESGIIVAQNTDSDQIVGFLAYSKDYSRFYSELRKKHLLTFAVSAALAAFKHPSFIKRLIGAFRKEEEVKRSEKYVELASIGVHPQAQGSGIGGELVDYLFTIIDFKEYHYISLETDAVNNEAVNIFYKKKGFRLAREYTTAEGRKMNEYRYTPGDIQ